MNTNNKRIAKNTFMLYVRQILIMLIGLYTIRVILQQLGVEDYGVYNVIGGVVGLFMFLSGTMASATQRFFSFALGKEDVISLKKTFSVNLIVYIGLALFVYILLETIGLWFVKERLVIPVERAAAAFWVYHFSTLTFIATIITTPFIAIIIAHENMQIYAYISIIEAILKLISVFILSYIPLDKLELYGVLVFSVAIINSLMYIVVCNRKYMECQFRKLYWDKKLFRKILGFTGWTMFGQVTSVARTQAITILINQMFNPVVVAARAIANSVSGYLSTFSSNFNTGLYPPIIKSYAIGDKEEMFKLIFNGSKVTFFLMWVVSLPMLIEMNVILRIWLNDVPDFAVIFAQLALIEVLINSISTPLMTAARAPGRMKIYELSLGSIQVILFFVSWFLLEQGYGAISIYWAAIVANIVMFLIRIVVVNRLIGLPIIGFIRGVCGPMLLVVILSSCLTIGFKTLLPEQIIYSFALVFFSGLTTIGIMFYFGFNGVERKQIGGVIINKVRNIF